MIQAETTTVSGGICHKFKIAKGNFDNWKTEHGGLGISDALLFSQTEDEIRLLKQLWLFKFCTHKYCRSLKATFAVVLASVLFSEFPSIPCCRDYRGKTSVLAFESSRQGLSCFRSLRHPYHSISSAICSVRLTRSNYDENSKMLSTKFRIELPSNTRVL